MKIDNPNHFYAVCKRGHISEVRICYDLGEPGQEQEVDCFDRDIAEETYQCRYPIRL